MCRVSIGVIITDIFEDSLAEISGDEFAVELDLCSIMKGI